MLFLEVFVIVVLSSETLMAQNFPGFHPDIYLTTTELITKYGYPSETHDINTEDGYILTLIRIPHGRNGTSVNKKPILLMHGLLAYSATFLIAGLDGGSLAYHCADNGYDVWLGNSRGTEYGMKHKKFNPSSRKFWEFSWHEIGLYDLPSMIDHVLKTTEKMKLYYVGYSQGGTSFYVLNSLKPEYSKHFAQASLVTPIGFMEHFDNPLLLPVAMQYKTILEITEKANLLVLPPPSLNITSMILAAKSDNDILIELYLAGIRLVLGTEVYDSKLYALLARFSQSSSTKQLAHYGQIVDSGRFRPYDYGEKKNIKIYGTAEPPEYPVENIDVPTAIYYSPGDSLNHSQDIKAICAKMKKCIRLLKLQNEKIGHLDFVASRNLAKYLNRPLVEYMNNYDV